MRVLEEVREQIDWHLFARSGIYKPLAEEVAKIITEVYMLNDSYPIQIDGESMQAGLVKEVYRQLTGAHVCGVLNKYRQLTTIVKRPRPFLRTCLYNVVFEEALAAENRDNVECGEQQ
jgi:hypothetical protein